MHDMHRRWSPGRVGAVMLLASGLIPGFAVRGAERDPWAPLQNIERALPQPLPGHPGNVFLAEESVVVPVAAEGTWTRYRVLDDAGETVGGGARPAEGNSVSLGKLPVGWYRIEFAGEGGGVEAWTTAAVLSPLAGPAPQDSPVCIDTAMAWFARNNAEKQRAFASLASLAGVNWARDRMAWGELETASGTFAEPGTSYDTAASEAAAQGLKVLQVFHSTPSWAASAELDGEHPGERFPRDLRDLYGFCKTMAQRYRGRVLAWEPWNEANIMGFGGHLINEMCSLQKAAFLAFKAGDPNVTVCWNVYAGSGSQHHADGLLLNQTWPYFETYNIHTYNQPGSYLEQFGGPREAACGRPIWLTECGIGLHTRDAHPWGELSREDELGQAEFVAHSYASSMYAGVNRHFFFILGNYIERGVQFGLLRHDLTPRPGYVALAAAGRMFAGAKPLGRISIDEAAGAWAYVFRARPGGQPAEVLAAWADTPVRWQPGLKVEPVAVYDYLGRPRAFEAPLELGPRTVFVVVPEGGSEGLALESPPGVAGFREGNPSPVVLQAELPLEAVRLEPQAYEVTAGAPAEIPVWVYNFSGEPVEGRFAAGDVPAEWQAEVPGGAVQVEPFERSQIMLRVVLPPSGSDVLQGGWVRVEGDFGPAGRPVVALRLVASRDSVTPESVRPIAGAADPARWEDNIVGGASMSHRAMENGAIAFSMQFGEGDPWSYPLLRLEAAEQPAAEDDGIVLTVHLAEGQGVLRVQFIEDTGAIYTAILETLPGAEGPQRMAALFDDAGWAAYSQHDPDGRLEPERITAVMVGINSERNASAELVISNPAWVRY